MLTGKDNEMATPARIMNRRLRDPGRIEILPLEQDPRYAKVADELRALEERLRESEHTVQVARARLRGETPSRPIADRAAALLKGGRVTLMPPEASLAAAKEEIEILSRAISAKREELAQVREALSFEACEMFESINAEALLAAHESLAGLHQALDVTRVIRGRLIGAGYVLNEHALSVPRFLGAEAIGAAGDPAAQSMSAAGRFREWLQKRNIL